MLLRRTPTPHTTATLVLAWAAACTFLLRPVRPDEPARSGGATAGTGAIRSIVSG